MASRDTLSGGAVVTKERFAFSYVLSASFPAVAGVLFLRGLNSYVRPTFDRRDNDLKSTIKKHNFPSKVLNVDTISLLSSSFLSLLSPGRPRLHLT